MPDPSPRSDPRTLTELYFEAMDRFRDRPILVRFKQGAEWLAIAPPEFADRVRDVSLAFRELGLAPSDRVALLSENRPEWAITDYACLTARCTDVPIYPTLPAAQIEFLLRDSGARVVFVSTAQQLEKILPLRSRLPALTRVIAFDPGLEDENVLSFEAVLARGRAARARYPAWREEALTVRSEDLATIIYTSGTTGQPKGVALTHGNLTSNVLAALQALAVEPDDECLSFLPLSHIFERTAGHYVMLRAGVLINYCRSVDAVAGDLMERRPTILTSVPRLYEKVYSRALESAQASALGRRVFRWAKRVGEAWADRVLADAPVPVLLAVQRRIADRLVFAKIRARLGGRLRFCVSGGAPLAPDIARFFFAAGIPILEGYGLTETSPVITVNTLDALRLGSVGKPVAGVEVKIAEDGEILTRGPHVMKEYYNQPEATAATIDAEGWLHTGDIGRWDEDGFLYITDRKKDLIVTAGGKNIAPQPIENRLKTNPYIGNAIMLGDRRKYPIALLVPEFDQLRSWAATQGISEPDDRALVARADVRAKMESEARKHLRDLAQFEVPKKFLILPRDLSIDRGELTPKLSVRRRAVEENFRDEIADLYDDSAEMERVISRS